MGRRPKPWWREQCNAYYATVHGVQHNLGATLKEAKDRLKELVKQPPKKAGGESLAAVLDDFLHFTEENRAPKTYQGYRDFLQSFGDHLKSNGIQPRTLPAVQLAPRYVTEWCNAQKTWNSTTKRGAITCLKRAFNWAVRNRGLDKSPIAGMEKPEAKKREQVISLKEFKTLLRQIRDRQFRDLLIVSYEVGARPQEVKGVEARHLDLSRHRWVLPPSEAKGKRKPRIVYLTPHAERIIKRLLTKHPEGHLFRNRRGRPWTASAVKCRFAKIEEKLGVRYQQYAFRHSFGHRMLTNGVDSLTVSVLMGHSSPVMLATTYSHLNSSPDHLLKAVNGGAGGSSPPATSPPGRAQSKKGTRRGAQKKTG